MKRFVFFGIIILGLVIAMVILFYQFSYKLVVWGVTEGLPTYSAEKYITRVPTETPTITPTVGDTQIPTSTITPTINASCITHKIVEGENFILLARTHHISEAKLLADNPSATFSVDEYVLICKE